LKQDARIETQPQPCVSPALCQGHADLPECGEIDDELDCPGELAGDFDAESTSMLAIFSHTVFSSHGDVYRQMKKMKEICTPLRPPPHTLPLHLPLRLTAVVHHRAHPGSLVLVVARIDILRLKSRLFLPTKGNRLQGAAPMTRSQRRRGSVER
jgi:hypothetical protein